jgi:hypothetical protein
MQPRYLKEINVTDQIEQVVINTLRFVKAEESCRSLFDLIKDYPSEPIKKELLWCALNGSQEIRAHCAATLLIVHGIVPPLPMVMLGDFNDQALELFRKLSLEKKTERKKAFSQLCKMIHVNPKILDVPDV